MGEYLVEGAQLICVNGTMPAFLQVPAGHGVYSSGKKKANCGDCKPHVNITGFGLCKKSMLAFQCAVYMQLNGMWIDTGSGGAALEKVGGQNAISMGSVLFCNRGGLIIPQTCGQDYDKGIDMAGFQKRYYEAMRWAAGRDLTKFIFGKDPINLNTGNFIYEREELYIKGVLPLSFHIFYNVMQDEGGSMGEGWQHNFEIRLRQEPDHRLVTICQGDGREIPYRPGLGDDYVPVFGDKGTLKKESSGYRYCTGDHGEHMEYTFDKEGKLLSRADPRGNKDIFRHNQEGRLASVTGANGGKLFYEYNQAGRLIEVTDHTGRKVLLVYRYGKLWTLTTPAGLTYTCQYNVNNKLESVITPRGIMAVKNEYDSANRVMKQITPDGGVVELRYDDINNRTYMKEQNGSIIIYESDKKFRNTRTVHKNGEEVFSYNDFNRPIFFADQNGNKTFSHYDNQGNKTGITDALGHKITLVHDKTGRIFTVNADGHPLQENHYDERERLVKIVDGLHRATEITYGSEGFSEQIQRPDGSFYQMKYDNRGNLLELADPDGVMTSYTYDQLNRLTGAADGMGNTVSYEYDICDNLTREINQMGQSKCYFYDKSGNRTRIQDFNGGNTCIEYDDLNRITKVTDAQGRTTAYGYNKMGKLAKETGPTGAVKSCFYDRDDRLERVEIRKSEEDDPTVIFTYSHDPAGNLLACRTEDGEKVISETGYEYDALNRIAAEIDPAGGKTLYTYNSRNQISSVCDPAGNRSTFHYNAAGELISETDRNGNTIHYQYNELGKPVEIRDGAGRITRHSYTSGGRLKETVYPDGKKLSYEYDGLGRIILRDDGRGYRIAYGYDALGRCVKESGNHYEKSYTYDEIGNVTSFTDANGNVTCLEYTLSGKLSALTDTLGNRTEYAYDAADRLIHVCRQGQGAEKPRETHYHRNALGWIESVRDAMENTEYFTHDILGRVTEKIDREGFRTAFSYTPDGKVENIRYGDGTGAEYEYTSLRQIARIRDWLGETRFERDEKGRTVKVIDHQGQAISYEWGASGERKSMTYPDGRKISYRYDNLFRLEEMFVERPGEEMLRASYLYDTGGRLHEKNISRGIKTTWNYDSMGRLTDMLLAKETTVLDQFTFGYDPNGNKVSVKKERRGLPGESGDYSYHYDALNRLTGVERDGKLLREYQYDAFGNRTLLDDYGKQRRHVYTYNTLNQLLEEEIREGCGQELTDGCIAGDEDATRGQVIGYGYDRRGNLTAEYLNGKPGRSYVYNAMNRLGSARDGGREVSYRYNGIGQRTGRAHEDYLLDLTRPYNNLLGVRSGQRTQNYYWDFYIAAMEDMENRLPRLYLNDELGSPVRLLYTTGKCDTYGYDEFGNEPEPGAARMSLEKPVSYAGQGEIQPFGYTGYRKDDLSGTYFAQAREYDPAIARMSGADSYWNSDNSISGGDPNHIDWPNLSAIAQSGNLYGYCLNNPLLYIDPSGNNIVDDIKQAVVDGYVKVRDKITGIGAGTYTVGLNASGTPSIWQFDGNIGLSIDTQGNVGVQFTGAAAVTGGTPSVAGSIYGTVTNAPDIHALEGPGVSIGGSAQIPTPIGISANVGGEFNIVGDVNGNAPLYYGITGVAGVGGGAGGELHVGISETSKTFFEFNIFSVLDELLGVNDKPSVDTAKN